MTTESQHSSTRDARIDKIVARARSLYSLPTVAAEVIQLTSNPKVDTKALKECIQTDPALTVKLLRVVNSSLFGLSREVSDLNQALALLGTKPLKLLVLGFSLPENLFSQVAREQLQWYWSTTLTRAVAAREISEQLYHRSGDDAFLAGLLEDLGILVLLGQLQKPYANFLQKVIDERVDLRRVEVESLGFDHLALTSALLEHWKMPPSLVDAIAAPRDGRQLAKWESPHADLARVLHLAGMLAELVGQNRLSILPDLLEAGDLYCGIDKERLHELVHSLEPKTRQLAEVMSLDVAEGSGYVEILAQAHAQMSALSEDVAEPLTRATAVEESTYETVLSDVAHLRSAVDEFLQRPTFAHKSQPDDTTAPRAVPQTKASSSPPAQDVDTNGSKWPSDYAVALTLMVGQSRARRQPVSVVVVEAKTADGKNAESDQRIENLLDAACREMEVPDMLVEHLSSMRRVVVLPDCDRQQAVRHADELIGRLQKQLSEWAVNAGVASVALPPKNFPPLDLMETAERCLAAAQSSDANIVKSLEIY